MENKKHIVAVTAVIKNMRGDKVLVVKRSIKEIAYPGKWAFPGGKVEREQTIMEALKREVEEEVGLEIENHKRLLHDYTFVRPDDHNVVGLCFLVKAKSEDVKLDEKDFDEYKWVAPEEFLKIDYIEGMDKEVEEAFK